MFLQSSIIIFSQMKRSNKILKYILTKSILFTLFSLNLFDLRIVVCMVISFHE